MNSLAHENSYFKPARDVGSREETLMGYQEAAVLAWPSVLDGAMLDMRQAIPCRRMKKAELARPIA